MSIIKYNSTFLAIRRTAFMKMYWNYINFTLDIIVSTFDIHLDKVLNEADRMRAEDLKDQVRLADSLAEGYLSA
jgi:hypothetical protein